MEAWREHLRFDPLRPLREGGDAPLQYFVRRDLLGKEVGDVHTVWQAPQAQRLFKKQEPCGAWPRSGVAKHPAVNYRLIETWKVFRCLVQQYGFTREHPQTRLASEFLFSCQTDVGDFRGMLANQYATYYTGAIMGLLIQAGYADDPRIERGFKWLLRLRQADGGWTIPILTHKLDRATTYRLTSQGVEPLEPDRTKPFSHNWTGMVLRAFAAHPTWRTSEVAHTAGRLLLSRFFQRDAYASYRAASHWLRFDYPFWWNNLVAAMDSLSLLGFARNDPAIREAVAWFHDHQEKSGLWRVSYNQSASAGKKSEKARMLQRWITLAICRILQRLDQ